MDLAYWESAVEYIHLKAVWNMAEKCLCGFIETERDSMYIVESNIVNLCSVELSSMMEEFYTCTVCIIPSMAPYVYN